MLKKEKIDTLSKILPKKEYKNNWEIIVKFLETPKTVFMEVMGADKSLVHMLKNISYKCWSDVALAQGWFIESYTPSVMYMTYDYIMIIYSREG